MDKTQQYIIRQSSVKTASEYLSNQSDGSKYAGSTIADIFVLAEEIEKWVTREGKTNNMFTPKEEDKNGLIKKHLIGLIQLNFYKKEETLKKYLINLKSQNKIEKN